MADYRLSAKIISRSKGHSAVASAAYRSAHRLDDERTGQAHDYSRRGGVLHAEIMAPEATPDWMRDRAQLWNAVEAAERRKDAQLAREVQLSLPHELTDDQRRELVQTFVVEQFVDRGMIADVAIHAPSEAGDERNHHAHVMLTLRELTGEGFGKKARDWNTNQTLELWRERWANHQNRALERSGHAERVDHRSFKDRGIDREPSRHLGPTASDMERKGKMSRIGNENRAAANENRERAAMQAEAARLASQRARFETWAHEKKAELHAAQDLTRLDLTQKHDRQKAALEDRLQADYGEAKATIRAELKAIERRLEAGGFRKIMRTLTGRTRIDHNAREQLQASLSDIRTREAERRGELRSRQDGDRRRLDQQQLERRAAQARGIDRARKKAEAERQPPLRPVKLFRDAAPANQPERPSPAPQRPPEARPTTEKPKAPDRPKAPFRAKAEPQEAPKPAEPSERLSLDDLKRIADAHVPEGDAKKLERPWRQNARPSRETRGRPWRSSSRGEGRTRGPNDKGEPK